MLKLETVQEARDFVYQHRAAGRTVGLVPTMGALHDGHLALVNESTRQCDITVATIFVNPTQFAEGEDLDVYPRTLQSDCEALQALAVDAVFMPSSSEMYPDGFSTFISPPQVARRWEGEFRPTFFRGVTTVVIKLFNALPATHAFFGRKDYQQLQVIRAMVRDLNVGITVVPCDTVRESDGLALSSRNRYLDNGQRSRALLLCKALQTVTDAVSRGETDTDRLQRQMHDVLLGSQDASRHPGGVDKIDYAVIVDPQTLEPVSRVDRDVVALIACHVGTTRLIDNRLISAVEPTSAE
tara:strand:+ start:100677 stop:101567 length:891 start_codon:yes stop_codon:yes gene_type:complete